MTERGVGKPWTPEEDLLLKAAVSRYGEHDNWKTIATRVPGRTNKACRKRWLHSLSPNVKKSPWTKEEDQLLLQLYEQYPEKWSVIARQIPGRTDDACSKRYREALDPSLNRSEWTAEEDQRLYDAYVRTGGKWREIGKLLNRSSLASRNRWRMLERKKLHAEQQREQSSTMVLPSVPSMSSFSEPIDQALADPSTWEHIPYIGPRAFWEHEQVYDPTYRIQANLSNQFVDQDPPYLSPEYSPAQTQIVPDTYCSPHHSPQHLPPFNYASSSLSSALALPSTSPSTPYLHTPASALPQDLRDAVHETNAEAPASCQTMDSGATAIVELPVDTPDLSSLGSTEIRIPVPFPDSPRLSARTEPDTVAPRHHSCGTDTHAYPTPISSPMGDTPAEVAEAASSSASTDDQRPDGYYRTPEQKRKMLFEPKIAGRKKAKADGPPPRLSASLPVLADHSIKAYVCGFEDCWPKDAEMSSACYSTSQELLDHWKTDHLKDMTCERPFKCGIAGCGKGWKSINGLQYHLQISRAHFQEALKAKILNERQSADSHTDDSSPGPKKRVYRCTQPGCTKQYKQLSGLKYHMNRGHRNEESLPTQLDALPPTLAKKVEEKLQNSAVSTPM